MKTASERFSFILQSWALSILCSKRTKALKSKSYVRNLKNLVNNFSEIDYVLVVMINFVSVWITERIQRFVGLK